MNANRRALIVVAAFFLGALGLPWGGAVPEASAQIQVSDAIPNSGEQGTVSLNVTIKGRGFKNGAIAKFLKAGTTDPAGVTVTSTQFVSSTDLLATVNIADTATIGNFDIQVLSGGRTGKGTDLFSVVAKGSSTKTTTELSALFRDAWNSAANAYSDKVHSDGGGPYYTVANPDRTLASAVQLDADGRIQMRVVKNRRVFFEFDTPVRLAPIGPNGQLTCREYGSDTEFGIDPPSFMSGTATNDSFYLSTFAQMTYSGTQWVYDPSTAFDFRTMPVDATASVLVRFQATFYTAADSGLFGIMPNYRLWQSDTTLAGGVAKVTHPFSDVWVVEPQDPTDPALPLRGLGPNEAGFKVTAPAVKRVHAGGNCDLGDWVMPFQITFYKR